MDIESKIYKYIRDTVSEREHIYLLLEDITAMNLADMTEYVVPKNSILTGFTDNRTENGVKLKLVTYSSGDFTYIPVVSVAIKEENLHFLLDETVDYEDIRLTQRARWCIARCNNDFNQMAVEESRAAYEISHQYRWAILEYADLSTDAHTVDLTAKADTLRQKISGGTATKDEVDVYQFLAEALQLE